MTTTNRLAAEPAPRKPLPTVRFGRLSALAPVGLRAEACLHLHKPHIGCRRCAGACPQGCLTLADGKLDLDATQCVGCGLCAAHCPTGALAVDGFRFDDVEAGQPLTIACRKSADADAAVRVPCLGGIGTTAWLSLTLRAAGSAIRVLDDGSCRNCPTAAGHGNPAQGFLAAATLTLRAAQVPADCIPALEQMGTLPSGNLTERTPETGKDAMPGRRAFFSGLSRAVSTGVAKNAGSASPLIDLTSVPRQPRDAVPFSRGHEERLYMSHFARQRGAEPSAAYLARVEVSNACRGHGSCARLCPTGALQSAASEQHSVLSFDAWLCIDCAACTESCPEHALTYTPPLRGEFRAGRVDLARVRQSECSRCGDRFAASSGGTLCDVCTKSAALSQAGFALFSGLRRELPAAAGPP